MTSFVKSILLPGGGGMPGSDKSFFGGMLKGIVEFIWRRDAERIRRARAKRLLERRLIVEGKPPRLAKIIVGEHFAATKTE